MSNKLNRAARRKLKKDAHRWAYEDTKADMYRRLSDAEDEFKDSMEHQFSGIWYSVIAIAMARARLSQRTIYKVFEIADDLYGQVIRDEITIEDLIQTAKEEAGMQVKFNVNRQYMTITPFETGRAEYDNLTMIERIKTDRYDYRESGRVQSIQH